MNLTQLLAFTGIALLTMNLSYEKEADDNKPCAGATTAVPSQAFALPTGCAFAVQRGEAKTYVINSAAELRASTQCGSGGTLPAVDFATYTLLAGQISRSSSTSLRSQRVAQDCQGDYVFTLEVADGPIQNRTDVPYALLVPKLADGKYVHLAINAVQ